MSDDRPPFWLEKARRLVGKRVLIGITYVDAADRPLDQRQYHGVIESADERSGFAIRIDAESVEWLPPHVAAFSLAAPGDCRLRSTGEVVANPDLFST
jgi:hypothetical protein